MVGETPHKAIANIKKELGVLKSKTGQTTLSSSVQGSLDNLTDSVNSLVKLFSQAAEEMKLEEETESSIKEKLDPLIQKVNQIEEENRTIAQSILAVADLVKGLQSNPSIKIPSPRPLPKPQIPRPMAPSMSPRPIVNPNLRPVAPLSSRPLPNQPGLVPPIPHNSPPPFPQAPPTRPRPVSPRLDIPPQLGMPPPPNQNFPLPSPPHPGGLQGMPPSFPPLNPPKKKGLLGKLFK